VPRQRHYYGLNHLHFLTASTYRRAQVFDSERFKGQFITTLAELRAELGFRIVGYVLMPEHCHLLIWPSELANPSQIMQKLRERTANFILRNANRTFPGAQGCWRACACPPPSITMHIIVFGSAGSTTSTSGARRSAWKKWTTCTIIR
jgi:REP element-mobilizing transposase RayT